MMVNLIFFYSIFQYARLSLPVYWYPFPGWKSWYFVIEICPIHTVYFNSSVSSIIMQLELLLEYIEFSYRKCLRFNHLFHALNWMKEYTVYNDNSLTVNYPKWENVFFLLKVKYDSFVKYLKYCRKYKIF